MRLLSLLLLILSATGIIPAQSGTEFAIQMTLGIGDREPTDWNGQFQLPSRRVLSIQGVARDGDAGWKAASQAQKTGFPNPVRISATLGVSPGSTVKVSTAQGDISLRPSQLGLGVERPFLGGRVTVARIPVSERLTQAPTDDDFPACAAAADSTVWCTYVAYDPGSPVDTEAALAGNYESLVARGNGDQLRVLKYSDGEWSDTIPVTVEGLDLWRPALSVASDGTVWIFWSQNTNGNWDVWGRPLDPARMTFGPERQFTSDPGADVNVVAVGESIAWQGWRNSNFDIWYRQIDGEPARISTSPANDWNPSIASAPNGDIWIAWDTYDKGDYDVYARGILAGAPSSAIPVASSPRFEARPSIAVDSGGRVWVAFEDAGENWGKDYGDRWPWYRGVGFYFERFIKVRALHEGNVWETAAPLRAELLETTYDDRRKPTEMRQRTSIPRLAVDAGGRPWLFYRRHPMVSGRGERWAGYAAYYDGAAWSGEIALPDSINLLDNRPALVNLSNGLLAVYSTDERVANVRDRKDNELQAAWFPSIGDIPPPVMRAVSASEAPGGRAPIHPDESEQVARIRNHRVTAGGKELRYLRGEFHRHTEISSHRDWDGPLEEVWRYGLDVAAMDWIGPGDHDYGVGLDYLWWLTQKQSDIYHHAGAFLPMFTYERSTGYPSGHRNVMLARRGVRALPRMQDKDKVFGTADSGSDDIRNLYGFLHHFGGICSSHTSATNMGTDWRDNDPEVEPVVEIFQGHRQNYEETNAPLAARGPEDTIQGYRPYGFVWNAFAKGYRLGFQASSDHVSTHISYGIVLAEEATREGIITAFKKRHSYAAHDNIILDIRSGDHIMGDEFTTNQPPRLDIKVIGTTPIARIDIVRQEEGRMPVYAAAFEPNQTEATLSWTDRAARSGEVTMYYVRVQQHDHKMAWASPMWIRMAQ